MELRSEIDELNTKRKRRRFRAESDGEFQFTRLELRGHRVQTVEKDRDRRPPASLKIEQQPGNVLIGLHSGFHDLETALAIGFDARLRVFCYLDESKLDPVGREGVVGNDVPGLYRVERDRTFGHTLSCVISQYLTSQAPGIAASLLDSPSHMPSVYVRVT